MQDQIYDMLMNKDEITWQTIIYDLIKSEQMDPWDIDVSLLAQKYLNTVMKLKEMNFMLSGKILLAAALFLKIKTNKLLTEDIPYFDSLLYPQTEELNLIEPSYEHRNYEIPNLAIKSPQARKRKVSITDLINALQKALEVNQRRILRRMRDRTNTIEIPEKKIDITKLIKDVYEKVKQFFSRNEGLTFTKLVCSERREDKIMTFIPLLHLDNQEKICLNQKEHFGEIEITKHLRF